MMKQTVFLFLVLLLALSGGAVAQDVSTVTAAFTENQPNSLDPHAARQQDDFLVMRSVCEGLVDYDPETLEVIPDLAESWEISDDGLVYTFTLREGVTFFDGSAFTAQDVKYSFDRLARPETGLSYTAGSVLGNVVGWSEVRGEDAMESSISGVEVIDDTTVQITLSQPLSTFLSRLTLPGAFIIAEGSGENEDIFENPVCTGPYMVDEWVQNDSVILFAFADHWDGAPDVDEVVIRVIPEASVQVIEFEAGNLDLANAPETELPRIRDDEALSSQLVSIPGLSNFHLRINHGDELMGDVRIRRALALAIDRQTIIDTVLQGQGIPADGLYPPGLAAFNADYDPFPYDPDGARALLAEAGFPDGIELEVRTGQIETELRVLRAITQTAAPAGIDFVVNSTERSVYDQDRGQCNMQMGSIFWNLDYPDPGNIAGVVVAGTSGSRNACAYDQYEGAGEVEALLAQGEQTPPGEERIAIFQQLEELAVGENLAIIPVFHGRVTRLVNERLGGMPIDNNGTYRFHLITLDQ